MDTGNVAHLLQMGSINDIIQRPTALPPNAPLKEFHYARFGAGLATSSFFSTDSLDSILTHKSNTNISIDDISFDTQGVGEEELDTDALIYRLCCSLYVRAVHHTRSAHRGRFDQVPVDPSRERNMSRLTAWMPLLHLFDPKTFYATRRRDTNDETTPRPRLPSVRPAASVSPHTESSPQHSTRDMTAATPDEATRQLMSELEVEKLSGGNSNHVYRLCHPHYPDKSILLRVYGSGSDEAIDRYRDTAAMRLMSRAGLSPNVLHSFAWGRVEEFMDGVATCTTEMLLASPRLLTEVYERLYDVHQLPFSDFLPAAVNRQRFQEDAELLEVLGEAATPQEYCDNNVMRVVSTLTESCVPSEYYREDTAARVMEDFCPSSFERASLRFLRLADALIVSSYRTQFAHFVTSEIMYIRGLLQSRHVPLVFSHNDLNPGNILLARRKVPLLCRPLAEATLSEDEVTPVISAESTPIGRRYLSKKGRHKNLVDLKGIICIDFEYADVNYRCYDLGNTLCELDYDYSRDDENGGPGFIKYLYAFPPATHQAQWRLLPMEYPRLPQLIYEAWQRQQEERESQSHIVTDSLEVLDGIGGACLQAVEAYFRGRSAGDLCPLSMEQLVEVFLGMLACHLTWALWSLVLGCNPDACTNNTDSDDGFAKGSSGLDYISYGNCRLHEFFQLKRWLQQNALV